MLTCGTLLNEFSNIPSPTKPVKGGCNFSKGGLEAKVTCCRRHLTHGGHVDKSYCRQEEKVDD